MKYFSSLIILFFLMSFMNEGNFQKPVFDVEGHRGCRGLMPENTIPAMLKAIDLGVTTLEMDVVITKDSQVLVSHEAYFNYEISTLADGSYLTKSNQLNWNIYK